MNSKTTSKILFAVGGVLLLLGVAFAAALLASRPDAEATQSVDHADALADLSQPLAIAMPAAALPQAGAIDGALNLSQSSELASSLAIPAGGAYAVGSYDGAIQGATGADFLWQAMPSHASISDPSIRSGTDADEAIVQAESVLAQVAALWAGAEVQGLLDAADDAGREHGVLVPDVVRKPLGASRAAQPDDDAAAQAHAHADAMLSAVGGGYGQLGAGLDQIHGVQSGLPAQLQAAKHATDVSGIDAQSQLDAQHAARLDAVVAQAVAYEASVQAAAQAHAESAVAAREAALGHIDEAVAAQQQTLDQAASQAHQDIDAHLQSMQAEADVRVARLDAIEADVQALLDAEAVSTADAQVVLQQTAALRAEIDAQQHMATQAAADAHAYIDAQVAQLVEQVDAQATAARQNVTAAADEAIAWAASREMELLGAVQGAVEAALAAESSLHAEASAQLTAAVEERKQDLHAQALAVVATARSEAEKARDLVELVQGDAMAEVGHDLDVILSVAQDHAAVPTPEREAAAEAWMAVHEAVSLGLDQQWVDGASVLAKAEAVIEASAQAEAAIA